MASRCLVFVACLIAASPACRERQPGTTATAARADLMGPTAALLLELGGRYLCDHRVYPPHGGPHISAWKWAFDDDPGVLTEKLAKRLSGVDREESTFRWKSKDGAVQAFVDVVDVSTRSPFDCKNVPASTRSFVVASHH